GDPHGCAHVAAAGRDARGMTTVERLPDDVDSLQGRLDRLDVELLRLVRERTALARRLDNARAQAGEPRYAHDRDLALVRRCGQVGPGGADLAALLLRLSRCSSGPLSQ